MKTVKSNTPAKAVVMQPKFCSKVERDKTKYRRKPKHRFRGV